MAFPASKRLRPALPDGRGLVVVAGQDDHGGILHGPEVLHDLLEEPVGLGVVIVGLRCGGAHGDDQVVRAQAQLLQDGADRARSSGT